MTKLEVDELLNMAIMSKTPCVIVEGVDDIQLYENVAYSADVICDVYSVEMVAGLAGGSDGVVQALQELDALSMPTGKAAGHYIVGILDRDARYYRGDMPSSAAAFVLDSYSIESHYVSKFSIKPCIERVTRMSSTDNIDIDTIFSAVEKNIFDLYYFSLDALKNAVDPNYASVVGYSSNAGRRKDAATATAINARKADLDAFAVTCGLTSTVASMRKFVKGKWLLTAYSEELFREISQLVVKCKNSAVLQCRMCKLDNRAPCLFQIRDGLTKNSLYSLIRDFVKIPEFDYIREKFKMLAQTASA